MKVLLTGAAGTLGSATYRELLKAGVEVRATDVSRRPDLPGKVRVGDLLSRELCYELVEDMDTVVHIANHPNMWAGNPQKVFNENVTMNMNLFQSALESGVKKIVYASSVQTFTGNRRADQNVNSSLAYLPLDGSIPQNPGNHYALSKCVAEHQLQYFTKFHALGSAAMEMQPARPRSPGRLLQWCEGSAMGTCGGEGRGSGGRSRDALRPRR